MRCALAKDHNIFQTGSSRRHPPVTSEMAQALTLSRTVMLKETPTNAKSALSTRTLLRTTRVAIWLLLLPQGVSTCRKPRPNSLFPGCPVVDTSQATKFIKHGGGCACVVVSSLISFRRGCINVTRFSTTTALQFLLRCLNIRTFLYNYSTANESETNKRHGNQI